MRPFLHGRLAKWRRLLELSSATLAKYNQLDLDLAPALTAYLNDAIATYHALERVEAENRLLAAKARFVTAQQGVDPLRYEPVTTRRRSMQRTVALHVLQESSEQVRFDHLTDRQALEQGLEDLRPLVLVARERGWVPLPPYDQVALEVLWRRIQSEPETGTTARSFDLRLHVADVLLLLEQLLNGSSGSGPH
jgi:hypothetical protein